MRWSDFSKADSDMAIGWIPMPHLRSNLKNFGLTSEIHSALELHCVGSALHHTQVARSHRDSGLTGRYSADVFGGLRDCWLGRAAGA